MQSGTHARRNASRTAFFVFFVFFWPAKFCLGKQQLDTANSGDPNITKVEPKTPSSNTAGPTGYNAFFLLKKGDLLYIHELLVIWNFFYHKT